MMRFFMVFISTKLPSCVSVSGFCLAYLICTEPFRLMMVDDEPTRLSKVPGAYPNACFLVWATSRQPAKASKLALRRVVSKVSEAQSIEVGFCLVNARNRSTLFSARKSLR